MKRWDIMNAYIDKLGYKDYLEIGLCSGICRDSVNAKNKTTVDPSDKTDNPTHLMTSDAFFSQNEGMYDIVFIDGLHEANQVYKDILNALDCLKEGGTIFCHDMLPTSEAIQAVPRVSALWTGDCWKAWAKLRASRSDLSMYIVESDWGVGVIQKGKQKIESEMDLPFEKMNWDLFCKWGNKMNKVDVNAFNQRVLNL